MARGSRTSNTHRIVLLAVFAAALPALSRGGTNEWTNIGPYLAGGNVRALAIDPAAANTIYAGTDGGIFKSVDAGATWGPIDNGLTSFTVYALAPDPRGNSVLYAGTSAGVFKSVDRGNSWSAARNGLGRIRVQALVIDPGNPAVLYAGTSASGVFKSTDGGASWVASGTGLPSPNVRSLAIARTTPGTLLAATANGIGESVDAATSWTLSAGSSIPFQTVAIDPSNSNNMFAAPERASGVPLFFRSTDGGANWSTSVNGLGTETVLAIAFRPNAPGSALIGTQRDGIFTTSDAGATWQAVTGSPTTVNTIVITPTGSSVYAGSTSGIFVSQDSGHTWSAVPVTFQTVTVNALVMDPTASTTLYAGYGRSGSSGGGVFKTTSGGASWSLSSTGLPNLPVESLAVDPASPSILYAGTGSAGVYKSADAGATWNASSNGLGILPVHTLAVARGGVVYAGTETGVFRSADSGTTWSSASGGLSNPRVQALAIDPGFPSVVYAGTPDGVFKSVDSGRDWNLSSNGLGNFGVRAIVLDPINPGVLYAGTYSLVLGSATGSGVYKSTNSAVTWAPANQGISTLPINSLAIDPISQTISAGTPAGVYRTTNAAGSWSAINEGIAQESVNTLLIDPRSPSTIYAGTMDDSVFQIAISSVTSGGCTAGPSTLCLNGNRFSVEVAWRVDRLSVAGSGMAVPLTGDTGAFWFFTSGNLELVVKVVDGRAYNNAYWVFCGALSDVAYTITVTDTATGTRKKYENPPGRLASVADTSAFPGATASSAVVLERAVNRFAPSPAALAADATSPCVADSTTLCLNANRFRVQVRYVAGAVSTGAGQTVPFSSDSGSFWFFSPGNLELNIKVVDGRAVDGHFWVFYGALSDVAYTITVTDTETGAQRIYTNPQGQLASVADTSAF